MMKKMNNRNSLVGLTDRQVVKALQQFWKNKEEETLGSVAEAKQPTCPAHQATVLPLTPTSPVSLSKQLEMVDDHEKQLNITSRSDDSNNLMKDFLEAFRLIDKDGNGSITKEELGMAMRALGQFARTEEIQQMLQEVDIDGDGTVSFEEFMIVARTMGNEPDPNQTLTKEEEEREFRDAFRVFDKRNRGYIAPNDLRAILQCLGEDLSEDEIEDMIKEVDVDGDGRIDFYEFLDALGELATEENYDDE